VTNEFEIKGFKENTASASDKSNLQKGNIFSIQITCPSKVSPLWEQGTKFALIVVVQVRLEHIFTTWKLQVPLTYLKFSARRQAFVFESSPPMTTSPSRSSFDAVSSACLN